VQTCLAGTDPCRDGYDGKAYGGGQQDQAGELFSDWDAHLDRLGEATASGAEKCETTRASAEVEIRVKSRAVQTETTGMRVLSAAGVMAKGVAGGGREHEGAYATNGNRRAQRNADSDDKQSCCVSEKSDARTRRICKARVERLSSRTRPDYLICRSEKQPAGNA
jgi:hypothetical protein